MPAGQSDPTRVALEVDEERWRGFVFRLSYLRGDLSGLEITRDGRAAALTAQLLQRVPLGALDRTARRCVEEFVQVWDRPADLQRLYPDPLDWLDDVADTNPARESDERLARLCRRYLELVDESDWRETLAQEFDWAPGSIPTIIKRARKRRFLTKVAAGQSGGQLTPKALRLLAPPKLKSAWERATEEQRASAVDRERRRGHLEAELLGQLQAGQIDKATYGARSLALNAALGGWTPADLDLDDADRLAAEREFALMREKVAASS